MSDYETQAFPLIEWSEMDCYLMESDGWEQDGPAKHGWIRYRRLKVQQADYQ